MKIIDLLNKIANDEEVPYEIICNNKRFKFIGGAYKDVNGNDLFYSKYSCGCFINNEVKIIEEKEDEEKDVIKIPEKIPEKIYRMIDDDTYKTNIFDKEYKGNKYNFNDLSDMYRQKMNEIIDYLYYLKIKEKK